jgi:branched-subunit amino acid ABC-type transport system permease component
MVPSVLLGMIATAVLSLGLDLALWRPLRARRAGFMSLFLASIGLALVLRQVLLLAYGPQPQQYRVNPYRVYVIGSVRLSQAQLITIIAAVAAIVLIGLFLSRSTVGRTMRALADDRALAAIAGIDVGRVIAFTWILSGLLAGLAGVLAGLVQTTFEPNFGFQLLLPVFAAVVLGGIGNAYGALAGGLALGIAMELSTYSSFFGGVNPVYKPVVAFVVLAAALMVRPQGLFGRARVV